MGFLSFFDGDAKGRKFGGPPGSQRARQLALVLTVGICLGIVLAERVYLWAHADEVPTPVTFAHGAVNGHLTSGSGSGRLSSAARGPSSSGGTPSRSLAAGGIGGGNGGAADGGNSGGGSGDGSIARAAAGTAPRNDLEAKLREVAPTGEVLLGVSTYGLVQEGMLETFLKGIEAAKVSNYLVVALDRETEKALNDQKRNVFYMDVKVADSQKDTGSNHAVSALKFGIIRRFLELGWAVLLSDVDVCVLHDPFMHLYRDSDVEGMTDGYDKPTAYGSIEGFDDPSMGWSRYAQFYKRFNMNSGLFYVRASTRTVDLMTRLETRLSKEKYWDQTAYNEEMFFLSHGEYKSPQVSVRVMSFEKFMNSKVLFKDVRHRPASKQPSPVMVHVNYHPDKHSRMIAIFKFYGGDRDALRSFPGGSEPGS